MGSLDVISLFLANEDAERCERNRVLKKYGEAVFFGMFVCDFNNNFGTKPI